MTKLNLPPDSIQLQKILQDRFLFDWYSQMLLEDYESIMSRYKYLGILINPEGFKKLEELNNKDNFVKEVVKNQMYRNVEEAQEDLEKLGIAKNQEEGLEEIE